MLIGTSISSHWHPSGNMTGMAYESTGESFWVADVTRVHDATARQNGRIMIPCCGFGCVPSGISAWLAVSYIRRQFSLPTARIDTCIHSLQGSISGGTLTSFIQAFDTYSFRQLYRIHAPFSMVPISPERTFPEQRNSLWTKVLSLWRIRSRAGWPISRRDRLTGDRASSVLG